jgi:hypothetical protein
MLSKEHKRSEQAFEIPLLPSILLGTALCCLFYFLILLCPLPLGRCRFGMAILNGRSLFATKALGAWPSTQIGGSA